MIDVCLTLKHDEENVFYARLAKSLVLALEEVSLLFFSLSLELSSAETEKRVICPGRVMCSRAPGAM